MEDKQTLIKAFSEFLDKFIGKEPEVVDTNIQCIKSVNEEKMRATFLAMMAYRDDTEFDLHGDTFDAEFVEEACENFNANCMKTNLGHLVMIDDSIARITQSYTTPVDMFINEQFIPKGSWLQVWQFADDQIWEGVKKGYWNGISPAFLAQVQELGDDNDSES